MASKECRGDPLPNVSLCLSPQISFCSPDKTMYTRFQQKRADIAFPLPVLSLSLCLSKDSYLLWILSQKTSQEAPGLLGLT